MKMRIKTGHAVNLIERRLAARRQRFQLRFGQKSVAQLDRSQVVEVRLLEEVGEARLDPGYNVATEREVRIRLSIGRTIEGRIRVYRPMGRDRLSDYARAPEMFRYIETTDGTLIVNSAHIVELRETNDDPRN